MLVTLTPGYAFNPFMSISLSKCPILHTIALFFILATWLAMIMSLFPVAVTKISIIELTYSIVTTSYPSIHA
jgi:hypothetical protein